MGDAMLLLLSAFSFPIKRDWQEEVGFWVYFSFMRNKDVS